METYDRGKRLKDLREERGLTHAEVGAALTKLLHRRKKIGKGTVWKWEKSKSPNMELDVFFALADLYDIDPRDLAIGKTDQEDPLPPRRKALINAYGRLPDEHRGAMRLIIETLDVALSHNYQDWSQREADKARRRDAIHEA